MTRDQVIAKIIVDMIIKLSSKISTGFPIHLCLGRGWVFKESFGTRISWVLGLETILIAEGEKEKGFPWH
jgi:hypothetical protein